LDEVRRNGYDRTYDDVLHHVAARRRARRLRERRKKFWSTVSATLVVAVVAVLSLLSLTAVGVLFAVDDTLAGVALDRLTPRPPGVNTEIYDRRGQRLAVIPSEENRTPVRADQISPLLKEATVAIEDRRF
jgi:membrane peptidoglycan carboxypeptidase